MSVMKKSKAKKGTMKRILSYIKPYKKQIIGAMLTAILYVVLNLTTPVLIGQNSRIPSPSTNGSRQRSRPAGFPASTC